MSVLRSLGSRSVLVLLTSQTFWARKLLVLPTSLYVEVGWGGLCYTALGVSLFGSPLTSGASHLGRHWNCNDLLFSGNVCLFQPICFARMQLDKSWSCVLWSSPSPLLKESVGWMVLDTFASPWILVYTVKRPVCLLISMIGGVCQLPTVLRQHLSRTVIWRLLSLVDVPYLNDQTSHVSHVGQAPSSLTTAVVRSFVLWHDLSFFALLYKILQVLSGAADSDFLPLPLLIAASLRGEWCTFFSYIGATIVSTSIWF